MMKPFILPLLLFIVQCSYSQTQDEKTVQSIFAESLKNGKSYEMLEQLTKHVGPRLSGSPGAAAAVEWSRHTMEDFQFDSVWLQPVMVPHWVRGQKEIGRVTSGKTGNVEMNICALGGSIGTGPNGITAKIIEVKNFEELTLQGLRNVKGKIVFFSRPMDPTQLNTFNAYAGAVDQRAIGASAAARLGAIGVIVRSMGSNLEDYPHTGGMYYDSTVVKIPAVAISTRHAELLSKFLREDKDLQFYIETHSETLSDEPSNNVIGEIKGGEYADEIILVGGHLDSWDLADGAHDDGTGCVQAIEALRLLNAMGYKPRHTLRTVMFMNEENGLRGGNKYAELAIQNKEKHLAAIESDRGGFTPRGFTMTGDQTAKSKIKSWKPLLEPYGLTDFNQEGGGADIGPLGKQGVIILEFLPDSQRYFDYHHTREDTFDKVNKRELELGAASIAALIYLMDQHGLK